MKRLLAFAATLLLTVTANAQTARPHILIVTVDDMNADSMGSYGCRLKGITPNMDALVRSGLRFHYAHVQVGNCMPGRNVMWSGRYPHNNGVEGFYQVKDADHPHLVDVMKAAGYFTAIRGKTSHSTPYNPYAWDAVLDGMDAAAPAVTVLRDYHAENIMLLASGEQGLLDFQDALVGEPNPYKYSTP